MNHSERFILAALVSAAAVLLSIAPLLRAEVPGWQIGLFAVVSGVFIATLVWKVTAPELRPPRQRSGSGPLTTDEIRKLVTPIIRDLHKAP